MSEENVALGKRLYADGDPKTSAWFHKQWRIWPERADTALTTNLSLHYGGVEQFRAENGHDPDMSSEFRSNVEWLDRHQPPDAASKGEK